MKATPHRLFLAGCALGLAVLTATAATSPADLASLREKAEQGNAIAQYNLGLVYADVRDPAHDYAEAYVWLHLAAQSGATNRALGTIVELMTPAERAEGERRLQARVGHTPAAPAPVITALPLDDRADTLVGQIAALEADKRQLSEELARAWQENESLRAQTRGAGDQRQRLAIAESALATKDREIAELRARMTAAEETALAAGLAEAREQSLTLRQRLIALETERDALLHQSDQSSAQLSRQAVDLAEARRVAEAAEATGRRLVALEDELQQARGELTRAQRDFATQQEAARRSREELAATRDVLRQQAVELEQVQTQLRQRPDAAELAALAAELGARETALADLQAELNTLRARLAEPAAAPAELTQLREELVAARAALARQEEERQRTAIALGQREHAAAALQTRVDTLQAQLESAPGESAALADLQAQLAAAQSEARRHQAAAQDATQRARALGEQTAADLQARRQLEQERDRLRAALAQAEDRLAAVPSTPAAPAGRDPVLAAQLETSLRAFAVQESALAEARRELAAKREQLGRRDTELADTRLALDAARAARDELQPGLQAATARADDAGAVRAAAQAESADLRRQLADLRGELAGRDQRLADQTTRLGRVDDAAARAAAENARLREELRFAQAQTAEFAQRVEELRTRVATLAPPATPGRAAPLRPGAVPTWPTPEPSPAVTPPPGRPVETAAVAPAPPATEPRLHTVMPGETLSTIARDYYGSASRWAEIFEANRDRVPEPNRLGVGTLLRIP
jgi:chromosome segregation ATPase